MLPSDGPYKILFQDPGLLEEAVRLIVPEFADALDFATATSLDKEHLTALARTRVQDKLRRVEFKSGALRNGQRRYALALIEFQSSSNANMAWRMRDYLHQVESALRQAGTARTEGALPPMLSIVVHNGERPWRAATECAGPVIRDGPPARWEMYATVDLQVLARGPDAEGRELAAGTRLATLAELESAPAERLRELLLAAFRRFDGVESAGLRRGMHLRVEAALEHRGGAEQLPPLDECERMLAEGRGETNMTAMMEANVDRWVKANEARGEARGLARGRAALLRRQAERRFGADVAGEVAALLADVTDVSRLDEASDWLIDCATGEALLARLRSTEDAPSDGAHG